MNLYAPEANTAVALLLAAALGGALLGWRQTVAERRRATCPGRCGAGR